MGGTADTLRIDSAQVASWQADSRFDYDREIVGGSENVVQWLMRKINEWLSEQLGVVLDSDITYYTLIILGVLVLGFIAYLVWWRRRAPFLRNEKAGMLDYELEEDTIYGVDFSALLAEAERHADWRQAVRLLYLQTLKQLSDAGRIDWLPSKTPAQYVREVGDEQFTALSQHFVRIRYGNFEATEAVYRAMQNCQAAIVQHQIPAVQ